MTGRRAVVITCSDRVAAAGSGARPAGSAGSGSSEFASTGPVPAGPVFAASAGSAEFASGRPADALAGTRSAYVDRSGPFLVQALRAAGWDCEQPVVVPDGEAVARALEQALSRRPEVIVTTGGTGLGPRDLTPEMTAPLLRALIPGIAEAIRATGVAAGVPTAMLSRGLAGIAGPADAGTLVVNLPGSLGGCRDGWAVLEPVLRHAVDQIAGGDH